MVLHDTRKEAASITADYVDAGAELPADATEGWKYPVRLSNAGRMLVGTGSGASTKTGVCDGTYMKAASTVGSYEFLAMGNLWSAAHALSLIHI